MANKTDDQSKLGRFDMKLDLNDPREEEVNNFLNSRKGKREASQIVKMLVYQYATGRDWYTQQPLRSVKPIPMEQFSPEKVEIPEKPSLLPEVFNEDDLDALDDDLSSWGDK